MMPSNLMELNLDLQHLSDFESGAQARGLWVLGRATWVPRRVYGGARHRGG